ncbi:concanavalin A-like lectin/glucanase domain-containing protein [Amylostereum chailletii]|nr:concanavalin A-like lectin/glucanase domain-containing protein [Amylostereum chailletii]
MAQDSPNPIYRVPTSPGSNSAFHGTGVGVGTDNALNSRGSTASFRSPFLSPASRPNSVWAPPLYATPGAPGTPQMPGTGASTPLPGPKPPLPSTLLAEKLQMEDKPWMHERDRRAKTSWWITALTFVLGIGGAAALCWRAYVEAGNSMIDDSQLCSVMSDDFDSLDVDGDNSVWKRDVSLGGFGNNEFQMTTALSDNLFTRNGQLYIMPTLTTATTSLTPSDLLDGGKYSLDGCTAASQQNCSVTASKSGGTSIPPIMSARLSTQSSVSIRYGKVEVVAKLPQGDWLWPAIWMLPVENKYGQWPLSGEIDIMEARGNGISYPQGINYVRSTLNWGPLESLITRVYGWQSKKRTTFAGGFHTYTIEWTDSFMKSYVDSRLTAMIDIKILGSGGKSFWERGNYPDVAQNGSAQVVVTNPYNESASAPFDQNFYLILDLAAGGTSGWFQDNAGGKPWFDASATALQDFTAAQATWSATWPSTDDERAFRIDSVKMWKLC